MFDPFCYYKFILLQFMFSDQVENSITINTLEKWVYIKNRLDTKDVNQGGQVYDDKKSLFIQWMETMEKIIFYFSFIYVSNW